MRSLLRTGGVFLVLGMLVLVGQSLSQPRQPQTHPTRMALVNLAQVFKGYERVAAFSADNKKMLEPYSEKAKAVQKQIEALASDSDVQVQHLCRWIRKLRWVVTGRLGVGFHEWARVATVNNFLGARIGHCARACPASTRSSGDDIHSCRSLGLIIGPP